MLTIEAILISKYANLNMKTRFTKLHLSVISEKKRKNKFGMKTDVIFNNEEITI